MGRSAVGHGGMAATRRGRTTAYAAGLAAALALAFASPASAQSSGGVAPADAPAQPELAPPPPGVVVRPAPKLRSWTCIRHCTNATTASAGGVLRVRGRALARAYEVVFLGAPGDGDDVAAAPLRRSRKVVTVRVPLGAVSGPLLVSDRDGLESAASTVPLAVSAPLSLKLSGTAPRLEVQTRARRAFFDAAHPAIVSYVVHGDSATRVLVELVRSSDGTVVATWDEGDVMPEAVQTVTWAGVTSGRLQKEGRYAFRVSAVSASGQRAVSSQAATEPDPAAFRFLRNVFPLRGPHGYGDAIARFGGGRQHQGQDVFASCGTPLWAARGGVVRFKQFQTRAGNYLIIDGERTGIDYGYMHMRSSALVDPGDRVRTGQLIGYVGRTGDATACHMHFEMWTAPGWYDGGHPFDPLPSLMAWDKVS
jgi:murein DD-endopeptidase MepM/ murein hydrolase activator NlpD